MPRRNSPLARVNLTHVILVVNRRLLSGNFLLRLNLFALSIPRFATSARGLGVAFSGGALENRGMAHQFTTSYLKDAVDLFRYYKRLGANAIAQCPDDKLCAEIDPESNSVAMIVKHMAGNMRSRGGDFL